MSVPPIRIIATFSSPSAPLKRPPLTLAVSLGHIGYPASGTITSGTSTQYKFPMVVTNNGNVPIPSTPVPLQLQLHNFSSGQYFQLANINTTFFKGLAPGATRTLTLSAAIPIGVSAGQFDAQVSVDLSNVINEGNTNNNTGTTSQLITIVQGVNGLNGNLVGLTPATPAIAANTAIKGTLKFALQNVGNLALPPGQKLTIQAVAIDTNTMAQTVIGPAGKVSVSGWAVNHSASLNAIVKQLAGLPAGTYNLGILVTPTPDLAGVAVFTLTVDGNNRAHCPQRDLTAPRHHFGSTIRIDSSSAISDTPRSDRCSSVSAIVEASTSIGGRLRRLLSRSIIIRSLDKSPPVKLQHHARIIRHQCFFIDDLRAPGFDDAAGAYLAKVPVNFGQLLGRRRMLDAQEQLLADIPA